MFKMSSRNIGECFWKIRKLQKEMKRMIERVEILQGMIASNPTDELCDSLHNEKIIMESANYDYGNLLAEYNELSVNYSYS